MIIAYPDDILGSGIFNRKNFCLEMWRADTIKLLSINTLTTHYKYSFRIGECSSVAEHPPNICVETTRGICEKHRQYHGETTKMTQLAVTQVKMCCLTLSAE